VNSTKNLLDNYQSIPQSSNDSNPLLQKKEKLFLNKFENSNSNSNANYQDTQVNQQQQQQQQILEKRN
jgi:hypothetical protein